MGRARDARRAAVMTSRVATSLVIVLTIGSLAIFALVVRQLSSATVSMAAHQEIEAQLRRSLEDQKKLARLEPAAAAEHRRRFDAIAGLLVHLRVVQFNRAAVAQQVERLLIGLAAFVLACGLAVWLVERRGRERRLVRLESALVALSRGEPEVVVGDARQDVIGRIAAAVERSARVAAQDRRKLRYLEHLSSWQEAARRHAHEIRTPLAAARMEVERLTAAARRRIGGEAPDVEEARVSILEEIDHLGEFTRTFTSFATIPKPRLRPLDLRALVNDFCTTFATAWPGVRLVPPTSSSAAMVSADGEMLRQVLANLAGNSALAGSSTIAFILHRDGAHHLLDVTDDGPGVAPEILGRLFEPYTTSRPPGEGMGLGLAISKKIMLDHGGDLDHVDGVARGATFRLVFPVLEATA
jgi:signal transduction histidine kinase